jgi:hypothetical protein
LQDGQTTEVAINVDSTYRSEPGYTISGTVKVAGTSAATLTLVAVGNPAPLAATAQQPGARGFAFNGLADGEYIVRAQEFSAVQSTTAQVGSSVTKRVTIKGASVTGLELIPTPLASISGRVVLEASKDPECKGKRAPLFAEMMVQLLRPEKEAEDVDGIYVGLLGGIASPEATGAFVWRNVRSGRYRFEPRFYARYWYLQSISMKKIDAAASWTTVKSGDQLNNVTITLAEGAASIRGRLGVAEVQPGTSLYFVPAEPDKATDVLRFFVTDVAGDGTFTLNNLPPGKYLALTQSNVAGQITTVAKLRDPEAAAARAKLLRSADTKKTEIQLKPCQNLTDYQLKQ